MKPNPAVSTVVEFKGSDVRLGLPAELSAVSVAQRTVLPHCTSRWDAHRNTTRKPSADPAVSQAWTHTETSQMHHQVTSQLTNTFSKYNSKFFFFQLLIFFLKKKSLKIKKTRRHSFYMTTSSSLSSTPN